MKIKRLRSPFFQEASHTGNKMHLSEVKKNAATATLISVKIKSNKTNQICPLSKNLIIRLS